GAAAPDPATLRAHLAALLPAYMLPQHYVALEALPLLPNGKLDRAALPAPQAVAAAAPPPPASSAAEAAVLAIARELLGSEDVQLSDNFFDAGGHSLLALTLSARLDKALGVKLSLLAIAQGSLAALAAQVDAAD